MTFGIEVEHGFAFHESILQNHLDNVGDPFKIIKDIPQGIRRDLRLATQRHWLSWKQHNGWGLTGPTSYPGGDEELHFQETLNKHL